MKSGKKPLSVTYSLRMTIDERRILEKQATRLGYKTISDMVRHLVLRAEERETRRQEMLSILREYDEEKQSNTLDTTL